MPISVSRTVKKIYRKITGFVFARYFFSKILIGFIAGTIIVIVFFNGALDKFELVTLDQRFRLRPDRPVHEDIVLIEMGEDSIEAIGRWPWPREWHATLLSILKKYGSRMVIFDIIFDRPSSPTQDLVFAEAIKSAKNVYLPYVFQFRKGDLAIKDDPSENIRNTLSPLKEFSRYAVGEGHVNVAPDIDGTLRNIPLIIDHNGKRYPQIAFKAACDYIGVTEDNIIVNPKKNIILKDSVMGDIVIPIDRYNQMIVNWAGIWRDTFKHISYIDIIASEKQALRGEATMVDLDGLKDKICIIGLTASGLYDIRPTPLEAAYPVVGMNANIMNNILKQDFLSRVPKLIDIFIIYLMGMLVTLLVSKVRFMRGAAYTLVAILGYIIISFVVFAVFGRWIVVVYPVFSMLISFFGVTLYHETVLAFEKKKYFDLSIRDGLTKLFNIRHFKGILDREFGASYGRRVRRLSLIMTDIDHFKNFNDTYGHQVGDFVLKRVAKMFKDGSRTRDVVARYGGEEFIMMLPGTDLEDARAIAERIRETIEKTVLKRSNETYSVTVSLGVATLNEEKTKEELIKKVDDALYAAKQTGRNRVCVK